MTRDEGFWCSTNTTISFLVNFNIMGLLVKENLLELHFIMLILNINWNSTEFLVNAGPVYFTR